LPLKAVERRWAEERYRSVLDRKPDLDPPRRFSEKILWRMLYDRRPVWRSLLDKYRVRDFVRSRVGDRYLVPLLFSTRSPSSIPFDQLPRPYVVKPTHMSGVVYRIRNEGDPPPARCREMVEDLYWYLHNHTHAPYGIFPWQESDPRVLVERMLLDDRGEIPNDYKVHCFGGEPHFVQVHAGRFSDHVCTIYDCDFNRLDVETRRPSGSFDRPANLEELLEVATVLSEGLDYIRVDLYSVGGRVHIGEMTPYDGAGLKQLEPASFDLEWGRLWTLPAHDETREPVDGDQVRRGREGHGD
jgi:hypothetical protein